MRPRSALVVAVAVAVLAGCTPASTAVSPSAPFGDAASSEAAPSSHADPAAGPGAAAPPSGGAEPAPAGLPGVAEPAAQAAPGVPPPEVVIQRPPPPATAEQFPPSADVYSVPPAAGADSPRFAQVTVPPEDWAAGELRRRGFVRDRSRPLVALDPGHGGPEVGAAHGRLGEKDVNLSIALHLRALLEASGYQVILTREADTRAYWLPDDPEYVGYNPLRADLQSRVDLANAAGADVFISIHNNGSTNRAESGTEVWYDPTRPFAHENYRLAVAVLEGLVDELAAAGYAPANRGLKNAATFRVFRDRVFPLFVLGNPRTEPRRTRATLMPGVLGESLFMSHPTEGALLAEPRIQQAIARGYLRGINAYFGR